MSGFFFVIRRSVFFVWESPRVSRDRLKKFDFQKVQGNTLYLSRRSCVCTRCLGGGGSGKGNSFCARCRGGHPTAWHAKTPLPHRPTRSFSVLLFRRRSPAAEHSAEQLPEANVMDQVVDESQGAVDQAEGDNKEQDTEDHKTTKTKKTPRPVDHAERDNEEEDTQGAVHHLEGDKEEEDTQGASQATAVEEDKDEEDGRAAAEGNNEEVNQATGGHGQASSAGQAMVTRRLPLGDVAQPNNKARKTNE